MAKDTTTLKERIEEAIIRYDAKLAKRLLRDIEPLLQQPDLTPQQELGLIRVQAQLSAVALRLLSDTQINDLMADHPVELASIYDSEELIDKVAARLDHEPFIDDRNALRDIWNKSLQQSKARIGNDSITLGNEQVDPTIANWIKVFVTDVGVGTISNVKRASFYAKNPSVAKLSENDRKSLRKIIDLYEFLKLRSDQIESLSGQYIIDDGSGKEKILTRDDVELLYDEATIRDLKQQAEAGELSAGELIDLRIAMPNEFGKYPVPIQTKAIQSPQAKEQMESAMMDFFAMMEEKYRTPSLAKASSVSLDKLVKDMNAPARSAEVLQSDLMALFQERGTFASFIRDKQVADYIKNHFPEELGEKNKELINQSTLNSIAVQALLASLFVHKLQLSQEESLWRSYQILQQLPLALKDFRTVVTYDVNAGKLVWRY